jgi:NADH dehydrogenase [ubiquinone] 1 alpha subcomplex assembly factor 7
LVERIHRQGPLPFDAWMEAALYDPDGGFFSRRGGAGRAGSDFVTSPEVGSLYGALLARGIDRWWDRLGRPDPFLVVEAGAGRGQLAREVLRAGPACSPALRYVLVERSAALREAQAEHLPLEPAELVLGPANPPEPDEEPVAVPGLGPVITALSELPAGPLKGVVVANELLDNLPFRVVERVAARGPGGVPRSARGPGGVPRSARGSGGAPPSDRWLEVRVGEAPPGSPRRFAEVVLPAEEGLASQADGMVGDQPVAPGTRLPVPTGMDDWLRSCSTMLRRGAVILIDYADSIEGLVRRGGDSWLRTYRAHARGGHPLDDPGGQDITGDVPLEALRRSALRSGFTVAEETTQEGWLRSLGAGELVGEARAAWHGRSTTDLAALAARSRVTEADALLDPGGLGAHRVVILTKGF